MRHAAAHPAGRTSLRAPLRAWGRRGGCWSRARMPAHMQAGEEALFNAQNAKLAMRGTTQGLLCVRHAAGSAVHNGKGRNNSRLVACLHACLMQATPKWHFTSSVTSHAAHGPTSQCAKHWVVRSVPLAGALACMGLATRDWAPEREGKTARSVDAAMQPVGCYDAAICSY